MIKTITNQFRSTTTSDCEEPTIIFGDPCIPPKTHGSGIAVTTTVDVAVTVARPLRTAGQVDGVCVTVSVPAHLRVTVIGAAVTVVVTVGMQPKGRMLVKREEGGMRETDCSGRRQMRGGW